MAYGVNNMVLQLYESNFMDFLLNPEIILSLLLLIACFEECISILTDFKTTDESENGTYSGHSALFGQVIQLHDGR